MFYNWGVGLPGQPQEEVIYFGIVFEQWRNYGTAGTAAAGGPRAFGGPIFNGEIIFLPNNIRPKLIRRKYKNTHTHTGLLITRMYETIACLSSIAELLSIQPSGGS